MPTGACGINCDVCKLNLLGTCSSCGSGISVEGEKKMAAQERILGSPCAILACAHMNRIAYCMRDCQSFPCELFESGPYPFSKGFLDMQHRRLQETPPAFKPDRSPVTVPAEYWQSLAEKDLTRLCNLTLFETVSDSQLKFRFLNEDILIDFKEHCLKRLIDTSWQKTEDPLLELVTLLYLNKVREFYPIGQDIVSANDLKEGHFFQGPHEFKTGPLLERYANDRAGFSQAAEYLHGEALNMADVAYRFLPFPRVPLYYLLWLGDEEFEPRITILFDRSIEAVFAADGIWGLVNRVCTALLAGPKAR